MRSAAGPQGAIATGAAQGRGGPVRVLIADDSAVFRRGMARAVAAHEGLELVGEVTGGEEAVRAVAGLEPDVLLLYLRMPDLDGLGVLGRLRELEPRPGTRVLVVSASLDPQVKRAAAEAGAAGAMSKGTSRATICDAALALGRTAAGAGAGPTG